MLRDGVQFSIQRSVDLGIVEKKWFHMHNELPHVFYFVHALLPFATYICSNWCYLGLLPFFTGVGVIVAVSQNKARLSSFSLFDVLINYNFWNLEIEEFMARQN